MSKWALILGGSSGIGLATAKKLSANGYHLLIVHRDRRSDLEQLEKEIETIKENGNQVLSFNFDATNEEKITAHIDKFKEVLNDQKIDFMVHSLSRGNLKPLTSQDRLTKQDLTLTMDAMAFSLSSWVNQLFDQHLFNLNASIVTLTSAGSGKYWESYAAVGMAKAALETMTKYLAVELAPHHIRVNCIHAGITDTPSLRMIPGYEELKEKASQKNPCKRMTTVEDVANVIFLLSTQESTWINGSLIHVDGGEHLIQ